MPWSPPPEFVHGNFLSAISHINTLVDDTYFLFGALTTNRAACTGYDWEESFSDPNAIGGYCRIFVGAGRKVNDNVRVILINERTQEDFTIVVKAISWDPREVVEESRQVKFGDSGKITIDLDISAWPMDRFYRVAVDVRQEDGDVTAGDNELYVSIAYEFGTIAYSTLPAFTSGVPTEAEWNALSTTAQAVYYQLLNNMGGFTGYAWKARDGEETRFHCGLHHYNDRLVVKMLFHRPDPYVGTSRVFAHFQINGDTFFTVGQTGLYADNQYQVPADETVLQFNDGEYYLPGQLILIGDLTDETNREVCEILSRDDSDPDNIKLTVARRQEGGITWGKAWGHGSPVAHWQNTPFMDEHDDDGEYYYVLDLDLSDVGLVLGADYDLSIETDMQGNGTGFVRWQVEAVFEYQETLPSVPIQPMTYYKRGSVVRGPQEIGHLRDNLDWLASNSSYKATMTPRRWDPLRDAITDDLYQMKYMMPIELSRRYDWLCYYVEDEDKVPTINYFNNEWKSVSLTITPGQWNFKNLNDISDLWPGTFYNVDGVDYALETPKVNNG